MMTIQVQFTDDEMQKFFEANGFTTCQHDFGEWRPAYHNRTEWVAIPRLAVMMNGKPTRADRLFDQVTTARLKRTLTPVNLETQRIIETVYKHNLKG